MQSVGLPQAQDHCWARGGWKKCILQDVFRIYYTNEDLSCPFRGYRGRDGMDAGGVHQMTCAIYRTRQPLLVALVVWDVGLIFSLQYIYVSVARMFWSLKGRSPLSICRRRRESVDGSGWHC